MITIEKTIDLLKADHNFREVINQGTYFFNFSGLAFNHISYDSRDVSTDTLFLQRELLLKQIISKCHQRRLILIFQK